MYLNEFRQRHKSKSFQMILVQFAVKRPPAHADFLRRPRPVAVRFLSTRARSIVSPLPSPSNLFPATISVSPAGRRRAPTAAGRAREIRSPRHKHHRVLDGRAQLAHVARPGIIHQRFERVRREIVHRFAVFLARTRAENSAPAAECRPSARATAAVRSPPRAAGKTNLRGIFRL